MKKWLCLVLSFVFMFCTACSKPSEPLSFDELMRMNTAPSFGSTRTIFSGLNEALESYDKRNLIYSIVVGEVTKVHLFYQWFGTDPQFPHYGGYSITEVTVQSVNQEYNDVNLAVGETIYIHSRWFVEFRNEADRYAFIKSQTGIDVSSYEEMKAACKEDLHMELIPQEGVEYTKYVPEMYWPLFEGETYGMLICDWRDTSRSEYLTKYEKLYSNYLRYTVQDGVAVSATQSAQIYQKEYGMEIPQDIVKLNNDLIALQTGNSNQEAQ